MSRAWASTELLVSLAVSPPPTPVATKAEVQGTEARPVAGGGERRVHRCELPIGPLATGACGGLSTKSCSSCGIVGMTCSS